MKKNGLVVNLPAKVGDKIAVNGKVYEIKGIHIYVNMNEMIEKFRFYIGKGKFVSIDPKKDEYEIVKEVQK